MLTQVENLYQTYFNNEVTKAEDPFLLFLQPTSVFWLPHTRSDPRFARELYIANLVCPSCHRRSCNNPFCKGE